MYGANDKPARGAITVPKLRQMKRDGEKIASLTAYDASFARVLDAAGVDFVLVGDSLGMVVQGQRSTLPVTVEDIAYHCACVARGLKHALLVADLPFQSYATTERALAASERMLAHGGASMVKLEGAGVMLEPIRFLAERDIPVCAHLGLTPQSVLKLGGYKVQGREEAAARRLPRGRRCRAGRGCRHAGAGMRAQARGLRRSPRRLEIPTSASGRAPDCDGQILVLHDMLGINPGHRRPRFVRDSWAGAPSIAGAVEAYVAAVKDGSFPAPEHGYA